MAKYTAQEYTDMIITYGMAGENAGIAKRLYAERFPGCEWHPGVNVILSCIRRARETGSLLPSWRNAGAPVRRRAIDEERILEEFGENPGSSVRRASNTLNLSKYMINRTLHENGLHPYHYQRVQQLLPRDQEQRVYFCEGIFINFI